MYSVGIDMGSVAAKAVVFDGQQIVGHCLAPTGWSPRETGRVLYERLLDNLQLEPRQIGTIVGTGYGRISLPFIDRKVTEITCHGRGAHFLDPQIRTVVDIGGQDSKVICLGADGQVLDFIMNDKCAAGTGRFLQVMAHALELDVADLSEIARGAEPQSINSMCTVFAESEVVSLMAEGASKESIAAGLLLSVSKRTAGLAGRVSVNGPVYFSGGVAQNTLLREQLAERLGTEVRTCGYAQLLGAIGAAVIGFEKI